MSGGSFSPERHQSRLFNRKLKMKDSFTNVFPAYGHEKKTSYTTAASHVLHPIIEKNDVGLPVVDINRIYTHKMDPTKEYSESMYKLGDFGP